MATFSSIVLQLKRFKGTVYFAFFIAVYIVVLYSAKIERHLPCSGLLNALPKNISSDGEWVTVIPDMLHVYSAYVDDRVSPGVIKVVAAGVHRSAVKSYGVYCHIWMKRSQNNWIHVSPGRENPLPVRMGRRYEGTIITCDLPPSLDTDAMPSYVSMGTDPCSLMTSALPIQSRKTPFLPKYNFTMCLSPIHNGFSRTGEILGYMEMNMILGADHFIIYNLSIGMQLSPLLDSYIEEGLLEVLEWKMPFKHFHGPVPDIHYFGQLVAVNDCLYRSRTHSRYTVFSDMDEIIAPLQHKNWMELLGDLAGLTDREPSAFVFRNTFFRTSWEKDPAFRRDRLNRRYQFFSMTYTKRETYTLKHIHSKVICNPDNVRVMGVHSTQSLVAGYEDLDVPEEMGLLFHYRSGAYGRLWTLLSKVWGEDRSYLIETRMLHFSKKLLSNVKARLQRVGFSTTKKTDQSPKLSNSSISSHHYLPALNFFLQSHPWAESIIFD